MGWINHPPAVRKLAAQNREKENAEFQKVVEQQRQTQVRFVNEGSSLREGGLVVCVFLLHGMWIWDLG